MTKKRQFYHLFKMLIVCLAYVAVVLVYLPFLCIKFLGHQQSAGQPLNGIEGSLGPSLDPTLFLYQLQFPGFVKNGDRITEGQIKSVDDFKADSFELFSRLDESVETTDPELTVVSETLFKSFTIPNTNLSFENRGTLLVYLNWMCTAPYLTNVSTFSDGHEVNKVYVVLTGKDAGKYEYDQEGDLKSFHEKTFGEPFNESSQVYFPVSIAWDQGLVPRPVDYAEMECYMYSIADKRFGEAWGDIVEILDYNIEEKHAKEKDKNLFSRKVEEKDKHKEEEMDMHIANIHTLKSYATYRHVFIQNQKFIWVVTNLSYIVFICNALFFVIGPVFVDVYTIKIFDVSTAHETSKANAWISRLKTPFSKTKTYCRTFLNKTRTKLILFLRWSKVVKSSTENNDTMELQTTFPKHANSTQKKTLRIHAHINADGTVEFLEEVEGYVSEDDSDEEDAALFKAHHHLYESGKIRAKIHESEIQRRETRSDILQPSTTAASEEILLEDKPKQQHKTYGLYNIQTKDMNPWLYGLLLVAQGFVFVWVISSLCITIVIPILFGMFIVTDMNYIHNLLQDMDAGSGTYLRGVHLFQGPDSIHSGGFFQTAVWIGGLFKVTLILGCCLPNLYFGYWMHSKAKKMVGFWGLQEEDVSQGIE